MSGFKGQPPLASEPVKDSPKGGQWSASRADRVALGVVTLATGLAFAGWTLLGPLGPGLQRQLRIDDTRLGLLMAMPVLMGSTLRLPVGVLADRFGGRRTLAALLAITPLPLVLMGLYQHSYMVLVAAAVLLGVAGSSFAAGVRFVETHFPKQRQGFALGIYGMAVGGTVATALVAPRLAHRFGLSTPFFVLAAAAALACAIFLLLTSEIPVKRSAGSTSAATSASLPRLVKSRKMFPSSLFYAVTFGGFIACFAYMPKLLVSEFGITPTIGATWAAGFAALSVGARVAGGTLSDRVGPRPVLRLSFVAIVAAAGGLAAGYQHGSALLAAFSALALAFGTAAGATMKLLAQQFDAELGRAAGVVGAAGGLGGFVPPLLLATMADSASGYTLPFLGLSAMAGVCLVVAWRLEPRVPIARAARVAKEATPCH
ncbi:MAG: MFS transporter [Actinobacteria bacterium]|nr:MFS transporter [Actinomycetota bacterium]